MLEDIEITKVRDPIEQKLFEIISDGVETERVEKGVYLAHLNFEHDIITPIDALWGYHEFSKMMDKRDNRLISKEEYLDYTHNFIDEYA